MSEPRCEYPYCGGDCIGCPNGKPERRKEERRKATVEEANKYGVSGNGALRRFNPRRTIDRNRAAQ